MRVSCLFVFSTTLLSVSVFVFVLHLCFIVSSVILCLCPSVFVSHLLGLARNLWSFFVLPLWFCVSVSRLHVDTP